MDEYDEVIFRGVSVPAKNKWTKIHPVYMTFCLMFWFCGLVPRGLQKPKRGGDADNSDLSDGAQVGAPANEKRAFHLVQGKRMRRTFDTFTSAVTGATLLLWIVLTAPLMVLHYRLFKLGGFFGRGVHERMGYVPFCSGRYTNPGAKTLSSYAAMVFDPAGAGRHHFKLLLERYGPMYRWPPDLVSRVQRSLYHAFAYIWRHLVVACETWPWLLVPLVIEEFSREVREYAAVSFLKAKRCDLDPFFGRPLRDLLEEQVKPRPLTVDDMFDATLLLFLFTVFNRACATSTFVERLFSKFTSWSTPRHRPSITGVAAKHVNGEFADEVNDWRRANRKPDDKHKEHLRRPAWVQQQRSRLSGIHVLKEGSPMLSLAENRANWKASSPEDKRELARQARIRRNVRNLTQTPLQKAYADALIDECELGGPWGASSLQGRWPLDIATFSNFYNTIGSMRINVAPWATETDTPARPPPDFPNTVDEDLQCPRGCCRDDYDEEQRIAVNDLSMTLRMVLRFHSESNAASVFLMLLARGSAAVRHILVGYHANTQKLDADIFVLKNNDGIACPYTIELQPEYRCAPHGRPWPMIRTHHEFLKSLIQVSKGWDVWLLQTSPAGLPGWLVFDQSLIDVTELRLRESARLQALALCRMVRRMTGRQAKKASAMRPRRNRARRRGLGPGHPKWNGGVSSDSSASTRTPARRSGSEGSSGEDPTDEGASSSDSPAPPPAPPHPPPAPPEPVAPRPRRERELVGEKWGPLFSIACGRWGMGAHCYRHNNPHDAPGTICKKMVAVPLGCSEQDMRVRLKRWLVEGLDDDDFPANARDHHIGLSEHKLANFEDGYDEPFMDRIVGA